MKDKNDLRDNGDVRNEVTEPSRCIQCGYDHLEPVVLASPNSRLFIRRLAEKAGWRQFFPKEHLLYGWRCMECGYVMWFTAKFLD